MKKDARENKNKVMREVKSGVEAIFEASARVKMFSYTNDFGRMFEEEPGKYVSSLTRAMLGDMMTFGIHLRSIDTDLSDSLMEARNAMDDKDITIRRMFDDRKGKRPLSRYSFERSESLVKKLLKIKESGIFEDQFSKRYEDKLPLWVERILKMDMWAYSLECLDSYEKNRNLADFRGFDDDGNQIFGISKKDANSVHLITSMQELLVKALVRLPAMSDEVQDCMAKLELIDVLVQAILDQNEERIAFLAKCAEAAKEFEE